MGILKQQHYTIQPTRIGTRPIPTNQPNYLHGNVYNHKFNKSNNKIVGMPFMGIQNLWVSSNNHDYTINWTANRIGTRPIPTNVQLKRTGILKKHKILYSIL
jgi:hypothetical protein